jgi:hypothetical protein
VLSGIGPASISNNSSGSPFEITCLTVVYVDLVVITARNDKRGGLVRTNAGPLGIKFGGSSERSQFGWRLALNRSRSRGAD